MIVLLVSWAFIVPRRPWAVPPNFQGPRGRAAEHPPSRWGR